METRRRRLPDLPRLLNREAVAAGVAGDAKDQARRSMPLLKPSHSEGQLQNPKRRARASLPAQASQRSPSPGRTRSRSGSETSLDELAGLQELFRKLCLRDGMDSRQFDKFCREVGFMDAKFSTADADLLFTSVTCRGRRMALPHFQSALRLLAERKKLSLEQVLQKVRRFADEERPCRRTPERGDPQSSVPRSASEPAQAARGWFYPLDNGCLKRHSTDGVANAETELLMDSFVSFCWGKPDMGNRDFLRLCRDCQLLSSRFTALDADLLYTKVLPKGQRRLKFEDFEVAIRQLAERRAMPMSIIRQQIAFAHGPYVQATEADDVRLHDDISSYTGTHIHGGPESGALGLGTVNLWQ